MRRLEDAARRVLDGKLECSPEEPWRAVSKAALAELAAALAESNHVDTKACVNPGPCNTPQERELTQARAEAKRLAFMLLDETRERSRAVAERNELAQRLERSREKRVIAEEAWEALEAERDRYRDALEQIVDVYLSDVLTNAAAQDRTAEICREALGGTETRSSHTAEPDSSQSGVASVPLESSHEDLEAFLNHSAPQRRAASPASHRERLEDDFAKTRAVLYEAIGHLRALTEGSLSHEDDQIAYEAAKAFLKDRAALDPKAEEENRG